MFCLFLWHLCFMCFYCLCSIVLSVFLLCCVVCRFIWQINLSIKPKPFTRCCHLVNAAI